MQKANRNVGRPSKYGFERLEVGQTVRHEFKNSVHCEKMRSAALAHARRSGKVFSTGIHKGALLITRSE